MWNCISNLLGEIFDTFYNLNCRYFQSRVEVSIDEFGPYVGYQGQGSWVTVATDLCELHLSHLVLHSPENRGGNTRRR
jgi:hypothetical protein